MDDNTCAIAPTSSVPQVSLACLITFIVTLYMLYKKDKIGVCVNRDGSNSDEETAAMEGEADGEYKLVLVIRKDLEMTKGKIAAQCCHATLACYKKCLKRYPKALKIWEQSGQPKITLKCNDEKEMLELQSIAKQRGLCAQSIQDAGRTQIAAGSRTVLGIGPGLVEEVDAVTGHLKLY